MNNTLNLNDITAQIKEYVRQIKHNRKSEIVPQPSKIDNSKQVEYTNDLRSNINKLNGDNKFSLQNIISDASSSVTSSEYASEAYEHLSAIEDKNKVIIDFMHKNNRNFDVSA